MLSELEQVLSLDPRPAYQEDETRLYKMHFANIDVGFLVQPDQVLIQMLVLKPA